MARRSARFYALRAASGADGSRPIPTFLPKKGLFLQTEPTSQRGRLLCLLQSLRCLAAVQPAAALVVKDKKQRGQPHAEHKRRVYLPVHSLGVMRAPALGNDNARAGARFCVSLQQFRQYTRDFMRKFSRTGALFYKKATAQRCAAPQFVISLNNAIGLRQISCIFCIVLPQRLKKINTMVN